MKSENKNFLYNVVYQLLTFIIPFITVPYISRVLGVDNVGIYSYTYSIVYMFMLVAMLGINNYGNRLIASKRDNPEETAMAFSAVYYLQLTVTLFTIAIYSIYLLVICHEYKNIAFIQGIFLLSVCFDVNWFFFGIEKFKLTISRNIIVKTLSLILVFLFVKKPDDLPVYTLIMAGSTLLSQVYLITIIHRYTYFRRISLRHAFEHFKGVLILFIPVLAFGIYKVMDKTMIGVLSNVTQLGYYENAEKLMSIPAAVIAALGTVMLPRMSYLLSRPDSDYKKPIGDSIQLAMKLASIMSAGLFLISDEVVVILFGFEFENSAPILRLLSTSILASAWANVIRTQYLIPLKKDRIYVVSTVGAAALNFILNIFFIKRYGGVGACIGTIAAEYFVALYQSFITRGDLDYKRYLIILMKELFEAVSIVLVAYFVSKMTSSLLISMLIKIGVSSVLFFAINIRYIREDFLGHRSI